MKMMKSVFILVINISTMYILIKIYAFMNYNHGVQCGGKLSSDVLNGLITKNLVNQHKVFFKSNVGHTYELHSYLYKVKEDFVNDVTFYNHTGLKINTWNLYNTYKHNMVYFYINNIQDFVQNELKDQLMLTQSNTNEIIERLKYLTISMLLTKQATLELLMESDSLLKTVNYKVSDTLLNGKRGDQFLGAFIQLLNKDNLEFLIANYTEIVDLKRIEGNKAWTNFMDLCVADETNVSLIKNLVWDLVKLLDPKLQLMSENKYVFNKLKVDTLVPGEKVSLSKFYIESGKIKFYDHENEKKILELLCGFEESK